MFTAYMLTSRPGSFENANIVHFFENLFRFKFYLIVEKLAKCYNSHFGTNNVFLTEDRLVKNVKKRVLKKKYYSLSRVSVYWAHWTMVQADINCMRHLLVRNTTWR